MMHLLPQGAFIQCSPTFGYPLAGCSSVEPASVSPNSCNFLVSDLQVIKHDDVNRTCSISFSILQWGWIKLEIVFDYLKLFKKWEKSFLPQIFNGISVFTGIAGAAILLFNL